MPRSGTSFQRGQSGNPAGRPRKDRALTAILAAAGNATVVVPGTARGLAGKRLVAQLLWAAATSGQLELPNGSVLYLDASDWLGLVKWLFTHIDGPARPSSDEEPPARPARSEWDLSRLTPEELAALEELITKATDRGGD